MKRPWGERQEAFTEPATYILLQNLLSQKAGRRHPGCSGDADVRNTVFSTPPELRARAHSQSSGPLGGLGWPGALAGGRQVSLRRASFALGLAPSGSRCSGRVPPGGPEPPLSRPLSREEGTWRRGRRGGACHPKSPAQGRHGPRCVCDEGRESTARLPPLRNPHLSAHDSGGLPVPFFHGGRTWHRAPGQGGAAVAENNCRSGGSGVAPAGTRGSRRRRARRAALGEGAAAARARWRGARRAPRCFFWWVRVAGTRSPRRGRGRGRGRATCPPPPGQSPEPGAPSLCPEGGKGPGKLRRARTSRLRENQPRLRVRVRTCLKFCSTGRHAPASAPSRAVICGCSGPGGGSGFPEDRGFVCSLLPPTGNMEAGAGPPSRRFAMFSPVLGAAASRPPQWSGHTGETPMYSWTAAKGYK